MKNLLTPEQQKEAVKLLKAGAELARKSDEGPYVKQFMMQSAVWDGVECDGGCWTEEVGCLLEELNQ